MSAQVHAPYHFVPLSKWVYLPDWAHLVSHDHPFRDGLSGSIEFGLANKTPLLVGAESLNKDGSPTLVTWTRTPDGTPVIPGSSLKGMLRSFLETATFAKFKQIDDNRYAYRDISGAKTVYSKALSETSEQAAWLSYSSASNSWQYRICNHTRLYSEALNPYLKKQSVNKTINNGDPKQNTLDKYEIWPLNKPAIAFTLGEYTTSRDKPRDCALNLGSGEKQGIPIFVGYRPGKGRDLDFNYLFYDVSDSSKDISAKLVNQMFAAHDEKLIDYLKANGHSEYGMPIFIRAQKGKEASPAAIGLARMPKMLYDSSVAELAQSQQANIIANDASFDLCELMFGTLRDHGIGLKSRVSFSDAVCTSTGIVKKSSPVILGQPKASYLNAYLEQSHSNGDVRGELTMYAPGAKLAGWKRYPIQTGFNVHLPEDLKNKVAVQSELELLDPGAQFSGKIIFHNLKPVELGALLWALDPSEQFYHGLGHGKSLGAGAVKLQAKLNLLHSNDASNLDAQTLIQSFVEHMDSQYPTKNANDNSWQNSAQLQHLLAFGDMEDNQNKNLTYMPLQKRAAAVTYSDSKVSGSRRALPSWQAGEQSLSREEEIDTSSGYAPRGRLAELVDKLVQDSTQLESMQTAVKKLQEEQSKQAMAAQKEAASPLFKQFLELVEHFEIYRGSDSDDAMNQIISRHGDLTKLLEQAVTAQSGLSKQEVKEMLSLVNEFALTRYFDVTVKTKDLSKKQKPRHQQKQTLLTQLAEL